MKQSKFLLAVMVSFLTLTMISSCNKDDGKNKSSDSQSSLDLQSRTSITPQVINGTLKFNSKNDAFEYLEFISDQIKAGGLAQEEGSENNPSLSVNQNLKTTFNYVPLFDSSPKDQYGYLINPVFLDDAFNLLMNQYSELVIGDSIYVHKSVNVFYVIRDNDNTNRQLLRNIPNETFLPTTPGVRSVGEAPNAMLTNDCCLLENCCSGRIDITQKVNIGTTDSKMICRLKNGINVWGYFHWTEIRCRDKVNEATKKKASRLDIDMILIGRNSSACNIADAGTDHEGCNTCHTESDWSYISSSAQRHKKPIGTVDCRFTYKATKDGQTVTKIIEPTYCN